MFYMYNIWYGKNPFKAMYNKTQIKKYFNYHYGVKKTFKS